MHPVTRGDPLLGKADDLPELHHRLARADGTRRKFVAARHAPHDADPLRRLGADIEIGQGHRNIVGGIEHERFALRLDDMFVHQRGPGGPIKRFTPPAFLARLHPQSRGPALSFNAPLTNMLA
ncbi:hypothetical protein D3C87_1547950 [compost metagenome]